MYKIVRSSRLYEQIVQQVEESIHKTVLKPGDQLPPEREKRGWWKPIRDAGPLLPMAPRTPCGSRWTACLR